MPYSLRIVEYFPTFPSLLPTFVTIDLETHFVSNWGKHSQRGIFFLRHHVCLRLSLRLRDLGTRNVSHAKAPATAPAPKRAMWTRMLLKYCFERFEQLTQGNAFVPKASQLVLCMRFSGMEYVLPRARVGYKMIDGYQSSHIQHARVE